MSRKLIVALIAALALSVAAVGTVSWAQAAEPKTLTGIVDDIDWAKGNLTIASGGKKWQFSVGSEMTPVMNTIMWEDLVSVTYTEEGGQMKALKIRLIEYRPEG